ncbi:hypothetical protein TPHA_0N01350 [Tetrapisispora phaffii CBS 4417]|uniref:HTH APSES-type domain-containing protein n=1 Tax=Tetrapisispora phaffii (strain ATCC 24235 / CBS 4417 / NBRC 1672 / NRRL Y-8282 / UCD 70-5) TaxID=1071381 RepID=G8C188_TETPH|nr:hypothetical protein TPHA_0N01350 [Tetrapisispora phaffii CBS 4417]CCE65916.1 hypothetical protein TPHA_0N01350 [Tetrapisispora phaffii CBS 4417]
MTNSPNINFTSNLNSPFIKSNDIDSLLITRSAIPTVTSARMDPSRALPLPIPTQIYSPYNDTPYQPSSDLLPLQHNNFNFQSTPNQHNYIYNNTYNYQGMNSLFQKAKSIYGYQYPGFKVNEAKQSTDSRLFPPLAGQNNYSPTRSASVPAESLNESDVDKPSSPDTGSASPIVNSEEPTLSIASSLSSQTNSVKPEMLSTKPMVITTNWKDENTICYQVEANGISVVRRADNDMINGTKLLNVTKMTRGRRDGILKAEKTRKVVKMGTLNLKGVWIPFDRAYCIARREKILDKLYPLFVKNIKAILDKNSTKYFKHYYISKNIKNPSSQLIGKQSRLKKSQSKKNVSKSNSYKRHSLSKRKMSV